MPAPLVLSPLSTGSGTTRRIYRRALGDELGEFAVLTVTATPSAAVNPDAARQVLCTALGSDGVDVSRFDGAYIYVADGDQAGEVRRVLSGTFDGSINSLLLDRPFSAPLASGTEIELSSPLPGGRHLTIKGLNEMVNEGLARSRVVGRLTLDGNGTRVYSLEDYPWLMHPDQIRGIYDWLTGVPSDEPPMLVSYPEQVSVNGSSRSLELPRVYGTGDEFIVEVFADGDRLVARSGTWAYVDDPAGLTSDEDEAAVPVHWVVAFGMAKSLDACIRSTLHDRSIPREIKRDLLDDYTDRRTTWRRACFKIVNEQMPRPIARPVATMTTGGGLSSGIDRPSPVSVPLVSG